MKNCVKNFIKLFPYAVAVDGIIMITILCHDVDKLWTANRLQNSINHDFYHDIEELKKKVNEQ